MTIQKINSSRSVATRSTYVGEKGRLFYDEAVGVFYISDGVTPGGQLVPAQPANYIQNGSYQATLDSSGNLTVPGNLTVQGTTSTVNNEIINNNETITGTITINGSGQNLLLYSENFVTGWASSNSTTVTANATTNPLTGTTTASKLVPPNGATGRKSINIYLNILTGIKYTYSIYLKAAEYTTASIWWDTTTFVESGYPGSGNLINLTNGTTTGSPSYTVVTPAGNGWYRCSVTATANANATIAVQVGVGATNGGDITANGTSGIYIYGGQVEIAALPGKYTATTGTSIYNAPALSFSGEDVISVNQSGALVLSSVGPINLTSPTNIVSNLTVANSANTTVTGIYRTSGGNNYTSFPTITIAPPTGTGGVQATASLLYMLNVSIISIAASGSGYTVGDIVTMTGGTLYGASPAGTYKVSSINGSGGVTGLNTPNYTAYSVLPANPVTFSGGTGSGLQASVGYAVQGSSFNITNAGSGYISIPTVTFSGGGTSPTPIQATAIAIVGNNTSSIQTPDAGLSFLTSSGENLRLLDQAPLYTYNQNSPQNTNFIAMWGDQTGIEPVIRSYGTSDANVNLQLATSGTGNINFFTNYQNASGSFYARQQFQVASTANAANYIQVTGATTGNGPQLSVQGTDSSANLFLESKLNGSVFIGALNNATQVLQIAPTASGSNYNNLQITNGVGGVSGPTISSWGVDNNSEINLTPKGTASVVANKLFNIRSASQNYILYSEQFQQSNWTKSAVTVTADAVANPVNGGANADFIIEDTTSTGGRNTYQQASVSGYGNVTFSVWLKGNGRRYVELDIWDGNTNAAGVYFDLTAGTYLASNIAGSAITGVSYSITSSPVSGWYRCSITANRGSISYLYHRIQFNSTYPFTTYTGDGVSGIYAWGAQVEISGAPGVYILTTTSAVTYTVPQLQINGNSTIGIQADGSLYIGPSGGAIQAQATTSSTVGGNARGIGAVDWQTSRNAATQVASGQYSNVLGGISNASVSYGSVLGGGSSNYSSGTVSFLGGGAGNLTSGNYSVLVGGGSNTVSGYYNFIGGGFTNSGTSGSAVTTQSGTMNGTTAVTLSGSNASIKLGQYIAGTSIAGDTYVAAISGTSLTLSKNASGSSTNTLTFYTPHGVVVGGGNNTASGAYSFIGGGGDAGTAANGNLASGDWSVIVGGKQHTASGVSSFIGGGNSHTASGTYSTVAGGIVNSAGGFGSSVLGGYGNYANGNYSAVIGGTQGTSRSVNGLTVFPASVYPLSQLGNSQASLLILARQTTDATTTVLTSDQAAGTSSNQFYMPANSAYYVKGSIVAGVTGGGNSKAWTFEGVWKKGAANSIAAVGTPILNVIAQDSGASIWAVSIGVSPTYDTIVVSVTGQASTTIRWVCKLESTEMTF